MPRGLKKGSDYEVIAAPVQYRALDGKPYATLDEVKLVNGRWKLAQLAGMSTPDEAKAELGEIAVEIGMADSGTHWIDVGNLRDDERLPRVFASMGGIVDSLIANDAFCSALADYVALVKRIEKKAATTATGDAGAGEGGEST